MAQFGERLRVLRGDKNKSAFARELGISPQNYQRYEEGRIPDLDVLETICNQFGVSYDWLFSRVGESDRMGMSAKGPQNEMTVEGPADDHTLDVICELATQAKLVNGQARKILIGTIKRMVDEVAERDKGAKP